MSRIVAAVDGGSNSRNVLDWALDHASPDDVVVVVSAWSLGGVGPFENPFADLNEAQAERAHAVSHLVERATQSRWDSGSTTPVIRVVVRHGDAVESVLGACRDASLLVVGTNRRHGLNRALLGSVAERLLDKAPCPVVVVPLVGHDESSDDDGAGGHSHEKSGSEQGSAASSK